METVREAASLEDLPAALLPLAFVVASIAVPGIAVALLAAQGVHDAASAVASRHAERQARGVARMVRRVELPVQPDLCFILTDGGVLFGPFIALERDA